MSTVTEGLDPAEICVVCGRPRTVCTTPGDETCLPIAARREDHDELIPRLAREAEAWAKTSHDFFTSLNALYTGKTNCGWCKIIVEPGQGPAHAFVCDKSPLGSRFRGFLATIKSIYGDVGESMNIGDIACALEVAIEAAEKPAT